jgi:Cu2+-exporting ATPase
LTYGRASVSEVIPIAAEESRLLSLGLSLERSSEHPLARAIVSYAEELSAEEYKTEGFFAARGGVGAIIDGKRVIGGNRGFIENELRITLPSDITDEIDKRSRTGSTVLIFAENDEILGLISVRDEVRTESAAAISELHRMGIATFMISGDSKICTEFVGGVVGIDEVIAEVSPIEKAEHIERIKKMYGRVAMVGDGVNDSVALTASDLGIAVGSGTDVTIDSGEAVLMGSSPSDAVFAFKLGKRTLLNIYENLAFAFLYNSFGIPLAAGVLSSFMGFSMSPMLCAAAMGLSSLTVVMNALRLNFYKPIEKISKTTTNIDKKENIMEKKTIKIEGMMCPHCSGRVKNALLESKLVTDADVSHERGDAIVTLADGADIEKIKGVITDAGYTVIS